MTMKNARVIYFLALSFIIGLQSSFALVYEPVGEVMFEIKMPEKSGLSAQASTLLETKMNQVLGRCNAGAADMNNPFTIVPAIIINDVTSSSGLMQNVTSIKGELVLSAGNKYNDAVYYSVSIPLTAAETGKVVDPGELLVKTIKPTDAAFVRFFRNARNNIQPLLPITFEDSPSDKPVEIPEPIIDTPVIVEEPPVSYPEPPVETPKEPQAPEVKPLPTITVTDINWKVKFISCKYYPENYTVLLTMQYTNMRDFASNNTYTRLRQVVTPYGTEFSNFSMKNYYYDFPDDVPMIITYTIKDVKKCPDTLSFVWIELGNAKVELRNVPVE